MSRCLHPGSAAIPSIPAALHSCFQLHGSLDVLQLEAQLVMWHSVPSLGLICLCLLCPAVQLPRPTALRPLTPALCRGAEQISALCLSLALHTTGHAHCMSSLGWRKTWTGDVWEGPGGLAASSGCCSACSHSCLISAAFKDAARRSRPCAFPRFGRPAHLQHTAQTWSPA
jgi:hypothetical protein